MFARLNAFTTRIRYTDPDEAAKYVRLWCAVVLPDFVSAGKYLWKVAVTLTVLYVWGWL